MDTIRHRTVIVTGASRGIGKAMAVAFGCEGAHVVVTARTTEAIEEVADRIRQGGSDALAVTADLSVEADIQRIADAALTGFGQIDILVNNAAIIHPPIDLVAFETDVWRRVVDVNLTAAALLIKAALPNMIENRYGKIINISSIGGRKGARGRSAYRVTKAGLISLTESVAAEVKEYGIDVNCICPGWTETPMSLPFLNEHPEERRFGEQIAALGRIARPEEIAKMALFLASDDSSFMSGAALTADGGWTAGLTKAVALV